DGFFAGAGVCDKVGITIRANAAAENASLRMPLCGFMSDSPLGNRPLEPSKERLGRDLSFRTRTVRRPRGPGPGSSLTPTDYRCRRPEPPLFRSASTSSTDERLKSPGMECFRQLAASAKSRAACEL